MMKKVKKGSALVVVLALMLSVMLIPKVYAAIEINTKAQCSLRFDLSDITYDEMKKLPITVDLYKVADVDVVGNYKAAEGFTLGKINDTTTAEAWQTMAADAMAVVEEKNLQPTVSSTVAEGFSRNIPVGLYLVVANNTHSASYEYRFTPYLISLPNNYYNTSGNDGWVYDVTTSLKPERTDLYGNLIIEKDLLSYNATVGGATFVFQVEAVKDYKTDADGQAEYKTVYSDVVSITFDAAGKKQIVVEDIPAGAEVTVTEVYSGGSYTATDKATVFTTTIVADEATYDEAVTATVTFKNEYDGRINGGSGVINHFEEDENGWTWTKITEGGM